MRRAILLTAAVLSATALLHPRNPIQEILAKGSQWRLNVNGESGILELLGGKGGRTAEGGWEMAMEIRWQGHAGVLRAPADAAGNEQRVLLQVQKADGVRVVCEGGIAGGEETFLAGTTRQPGTGGEWRGAWCAFPQPASGDRRPAPEFRRDIRAGDLRQPVDTDREAPRVTLEVEGLLVFTLNDTIKLKGQAEDSGKLAKVEIFMDGVMVKSCPAWACYHSQKLTVAGPHLCWAEAEDQAGNRGKSEVREIMVQPTAKPGPSLTTRISPYNPDSLHPVRFIASASHPSGVKSITFVINGQEVKTVHDASAEYVGGPYTADVSWRVSAVANDGGETYGTTRTVAIAAIASGSGAITGRAVGPRADAARVFSVNLYGPDDPGKYRAQTGFGADGRFAFPGLPPGRYRLVVDTKADMGVTVAGNPRTVDCRGIVDGIDFEFK